MITVGDDKFDLTLNVAIVPQETILTDLSFVLYSFLWTQMTRACRPFRRFPHAYWTAIPCAADPSAIQHPIPNLTTRHEFSAHSNSISAKAHFRTSNRADNPRISATPRTINETLFYLTAIIRDISLSDFRYPVLGQGNFRRHRKESVKITFYSLDVINRGQLGLRKNPSQGKYRAAVQKSHSLPSRRKLVCFT